MTDYALYLASGPQKRTTFVHAPGLLGCAYQRPTTEGAMGAAQDEIRAFRAFLSLHGGDVDRGGEFTVSVAEHDTSGRFPGSGGMATDVEPCSEEECQGLVARLEWIRDATFALVDHLSAEEMTAAPEKGRPMDRILSHILGADYSYLSAGGLKVPGLHALYAAADRGEGDARHILREATARSMARLTAMTVEERERVVERSTGRWTARRMLRRLLEHNWEHYREIRDRREGPG